MTHCTQCGVTADELAKPWGALLVHAVVVFKKRYTWAECLKCARKERDRQ